MPRTWFTADFHLGHSNIIRYCKRPFADTIEMDEVVLTRLNAFVKAEDELYYLGDFCMGGPKMALAYRERIRCRRIYFILGNHDRVILKIADRFTWVKELAEVTVRNQRIVLCHYAMRTWHQSARGAWHLYGHSHGNLSPLDGSRSLDVGIDTHDFQPYSFEELHERLSAVGNDNVENVAPD